MRKKGNFILLTESKENIFHASISWIKMKIIEKKNLINE